MNKKRFIAKVLLLAMLVQYTSGPVLAYADNEKVLQEESSIEENITDDETEETDKVEAEGNILKGEKADNTTAQIIESGNLGPDETYAPWTLDNAGVLRMYTGKMGENNNKKWINHVDKITKIIVGVKKDTDTGDERLKLPKNMGGYFSINNKNISEIEFRDIDSSEVTNMNSFFRDISSLEILDLGTNFDTSKVNDMSKMFNGIEKLKVLKLGDKFNASNVTTMEEMFFHMYSLEELKLGDKFDTSDVTNMSKMFLGMESLQELELGDKFNTSKVTNMYEMFYKMHGLKTLDLSGFDTSKVTKKSRMIGDINFEKLTLGENIRIDGTNLNTIVSNRQFTGGWINKEKNKIYTRSSEFMEKYDGTLPGTYEREIKKHNVRFDANEGILTGIIDEEVEYGQRVTEPTEVKNPTRENYIFEGWTKTRDGEDFFNFEEETIYYYTTLYAKWKGEEQTVIFDSNGGTEVSPQEIEYDELLAKPENPTKDNYIFEGWTKTQGGEDFFNFDEETIKDPITLFAKWKGEEQTVIFNVNGGTKVATQKVEYDKFAIKPENPTRDGYNFIGWYTDKVLTDEYNFDNPVNFDINLYAKWEEKRLSKTVIIANGEKYTDVLTGTVLANEKNASILLVNKNSISEDTMKEIKRINPVEIIISGGEISVSKQVENKLTDYEIIRISGKDRYETAKNIGEKVREISPNKTEAMLVDGTNFPDVITMSTIASEKRIPILLHNPENVEESKKNINDMEINNIIIGGGENSVSKDMEDSLKSDKIITRYGGSDRYETASIVGNAYRSMAGVSNNLIMVDGTNFPDGITTNSLSSKLKAPILLTAPNSLPEIIAKDINTWKATNIIIAGGENSVSANIFNKINGSERISGKDRYETAIKISQKYLKDE